MRIRSGMFTGSMSIAVQGRIVPAFVFVTGALSMEESWRVRSGFCLWGVGVGLYSCLMNCAIEE